MHSSSTPCRTPYPTPQPRPARPSSILLRARPSRPPSTHCWPTRPPSTRCPLPSTRYARAPTRGLGEQTRGAGLSCVALCACVQLPSCDGRGWNVCGGAGAMWRAASNPARAALSSCQPTRLPPCWRGTAGAFCVAALGDRGPRRHHHGGEPPVAGGPRGGGHARERAVRCVGVCVWREYVSVCVRVRDRPS